jgi:hypothetical protein
MKHLKLAMIGTALVLVTMVATEADAKKMKKPPKGSRTEKTEEMKIPRRFDNYPPMHFLGGILTRDGMSGWKVGEIPLYLHKDCVITMDGADEGWLEEGRNAVVMGAKIGNAISAWSVHLSLPEFSNAEYSSKKELKEAGNNPNVGKIIKKAE